MTEEAKRCVTDLQWLISYYPKWHEEADPCTVMEEAISLIESLSAELEQVKRERDALMDELRGRCYSCANVKPYEKIPRMNVCEHIKVVFSGEGKRGCEYWQWRGVKEERDE